MTDREHQPDPFADTFAAAAGARAVIAATRLGVFDALADEPARPEALAERLRLDPVGVEALFTALLSLGYLEAADDGVHSPSDLARRTLVSSSPEYLGHFVGGYNAAAWEMLGSLEAVLRGERRPPGHTSEDAGFWEDYIRGLFELSRAEHAANAALVGAPGPRSLLDIAGGHGGFAMAMCERHRELVATVLDLPASAAVGRAIVAEQGFAGRVSFEEGDALEAPLGEALDVISVFNLLHHLGAEQVGALLARARAALAAGGRIVIGETERTEPGQRVSFRGAMSGLTYYAASGTRNYSAQELTGWLAEAGFSGIAVHRNERSPWRLLYVGLAA